MKKFAKVLAVVLCVFAVFSLAGCGMFGKPMVFPAGFSTDGTLANTFNGSDESDLDILGLDDQVDKTSDWYSMF